MIGVYVNGDMDQKLMGLRGWMEGREQGMKIVIGGDFNTRRKARKEGTSCGKIEMGIRRIGSQRIRTQ